MVRLPTGDIVFHVDGKYSFVVRASSANAFGSVRLYGKRPPIMANTITLRKEAGQLEARVAIIQTTHPRLHMSDGRE